jgi:hypothetical protein|tara:strand:+ start:9 stop:980 length:972 start_codon:yes stop_codon:yes gene_type:complete
MASLENGLNQTEQELYLLISKFRLIFFVHLEIAKIFCLSKVNLLTTFLLLLTQVFAFGQDGGQILLKSVEEIQRLTSLQFEMVSNERIEGELLQSKSLTKTEMNPYRSYLKGILGDGTRGPELLYAKDKNNNEVLVSPNKFPFFNIKTKPNSWILRKGHHYTVEENIYTFISKVMVNEFKKLGHDNLDQYVSMQDDVLYNNKKCYHITTNWTEFEWIRYKVKNGETLTSISQSKRICDTQVLFKNDDVDSYEDVETGDDILIPNHYAKQVIFYIEKTSLLPLYIKISDEKGVFAIYEISELIINPEFNELDFSTENEDYNFKY